jgi:hypothetical protein
MPNRSMMMDFAPKSGTSEALTVSEGAIGGDRVHDLSDSRSPFNFTSGLLLEHWRKLFHPGAGREEPAGAQPASSRIAQT